MSVERDTRSRRTCLSGDVLLTTRDYFSAIAPFLPVRFLYGVVARVSRFHYGFLCGDKSNGGWLRTLIKAQASDSAAVLVSEHNSHRHANAEALSAMVDTLFDALRPRHFGLKPYGFSFTRILGYFYFADFVWEQIGDESNAADSAEGLEQDKALLLELSRQKKEVVKKLMCDGMLWQICSSLEQMDTFDGATVAMMRQKAETASMEFLIEIISNPPLFFKRTLPPRLTWRKFVRRHYHREDSDRIQEGALCELANMAAMDMSAFVAKGGLDGLRTFLRLGPQRMDFRLKAFERIIGNIASDEYLDVVLENFDFYAAIGEWLQHREDCIRKGALLALSNILVSGTHSKRAPFFKDMRLIGMVLSLAIGGGADVRKAAGWVLHNAVKSSSLPELNSVLGAGFFRAVHTYMHCQSTVSETMDAGIEAVDRCLQFGSKNSSALALWCGGWHRTAAARL